MFTGIIEEIGMIEQVLKKSTTYELQIQAKEILHDIKVGASISVNGVCLTVTSFTNTNFTADIMPETLFASNIRYLQSGDPVNLERAMAANGRFGGHLVSGHIDGTGKIIAKRPVANAVYYEIEIDEHLTKFIVNKGSIAVDGTSLTVFDVTDHSFTISLIPLTMQDTVIGKKAVGDIVNIECDMIGKYIYRFLNKEQDQQKNQEKSTITSEFLKEHGFF